MNPDKFSALLDSLAPVVRSVLRRVNNWRTPVNWSRADWASEERAVIDLAVCQFVSDWNADSDHLAQTVYFHALARALTRYRQECLYSGRFRPFARVDGHDESEERDNSPTSHFHLPPEDTSMQEWLATAMESLPEADGQLIHQLFWCERTQADVADELQISQRAVSERRRRALEKLRSALL